jgi:glycosyltransferase involved in cell wall biosynthesis
VAVIPAYNEARFIGSIVLQARQLVEKVIVIDDGSTDFTADIADAAGAIVIKHGTNEGYGAAIETGLEQARAMGAEATVLLDGDGQHDPGQISAVLAPILSGQADMVVGSRYMNTNNTTPRSRTIAHRVVTSITNQFSGQKLSDSQCGFRAFSRRALQDACLSSEGMSAASEFQFLASRFNWRVSEVPVTVLYDGRKKRSLMMQGLQVLNGIVSMIGQSRPLFFFGLSGALLLLGGLAWGVWVVEIFRRSSQLAVGYALISVLLSIVGMLLISTGIILHSVRGLLHTYLDQEKRKEA